MHLGFHLVSTEQGWALTQRRSRAQSFHEVWRFEGGGCLAAAAALRAHAQGADAVHALPEVQTAEELLLRAAAKRFRQGATTPSSCRDPWCSPKWAYGILIS